MELVWVLGWLVVLVGAVAWWWVRYRHLVLKNRKLRLEIGRLESQTRRSGKVEAGRQRLARLVVEAPEGDEIRLILGRSGWVLPLGGPCGPKEVRIAVGGRSGWLGMVQMMSADYALLLAMSDDRAMRDLGVVQLRNLAEAGSDRAAEYLGIVARSALDADGFRI